MMEKQDMNRPSFVEDFFVGRGGLVERQAVVGCLEELV